MIIIKEPININNIVEMASNRYGDMVKAVADVRRELVAVDSDLHSDLETLLLDKKHIQHSKTALLPLTYRGFIQIRPSSLKNRFKF